MKKSILPLALFLFTAAASAYPLYEPFNYDPSSNTNLIGQTSPDGLVWSQAGPTTALTNQPYIAIGSLSYPGLAPSIGNSAKAVGPTGTTGLAARFSLPAAVTSGTLYYSFLTKISDITSLNSAGIFWAGFNNSSGSQTGVPTVIATRVITKTNAAGGFVLGLDKTSGQVANFVYATNVFSISDTIFVVGSYTFNTGTASDDVSQMWINPDSSTFGAASPPSENMLTSTATGDIGSAQIVSFLLFQGRNNTSGVQPYAIQFDELMISTNWADVTPTAPAITAQPQSQRALAGNSASFSVSAIKVAGYQWRFNGANMPGQNSSSLTFANVQAGSAGSYDVIATNGATSVTSSVVTLTVVPDVYPRLRTLWSIPPNTPNYPYVTVDASGTPFCRNLAYNSLSNQILVASRTNYLIGGTNGIYVLDASTGSNLWTLDTTVVSGGQLPLTCVDVSGDGSVYACNEANAVGTAFNVYRWPDSASGQSGTMVYSGIPAGNHANDNTPRWGDTLRARGSGLSTEVIVDSNDGNWAAVFTPTDGSLTSFQPEAYTNFLGTGSIGRSLQFGNTNSFYSKRKGAAMQLATYDPPAIEGFPWSTCTVLTNFGNFPAAVGQVAFPLGSNLLCAIEYGTSSSIPDTLDLFAVSDMSQPVLIAKYNFPTNHQANGNFIGQVLFGGTNVYALDANNGILAMTWVPFRPPLDISVVGSNVQISWTTNATGYTLYSSPAVSPTTWSLVGTGTISGANYVVTSPVSAAPKFYRLQK